MADRNTTKNAHAYIVRAERGGPRATEATCASLQDAKDLAFQWYEQILDARVIFIYGPRKTKGRDYEILCMYGKARR